MFLAVEYIIKHPTHTLPLPSPLASAKLLVILVIFISKATITSILLWPDPFESIVTREQPAGSDFHPAAICRHLKSQTKLSSKVLYPVVVLAIGTTK